MKTHLPDDTVLSARQLNRIHRRLRELIVTADTQDATSGHDHSYIKTEVYDMFVRDLGLPTFTLHREPNHVPELADIETLPETLGDLKHVLRSCLPDPSLRETVLHAPQYKICSVGSRQYSTREIYTLAQRVADTLMAELPQLLAERQRGR